MFAHPRSTARGAPTHAVPPNWPEVAHGLIRRTVIVGGNTQIFSIVNIYKFTPPVAGLFPMLPKFWWNN